ncbi:Hypothetical protein PENO1_111800 [Penicillium occitanis (nom. inval.)]|nr:Hypothetical protein PENO1_111800 [Penicillium occitanis (nom. inval.)]PCG88278.1 hypothetical protein PENOC_111710 [Penicillium occitanis (nom. inval.)]
MVNPILREASPYDISSQFDTTSPYDTSQLWNAPTPGFPGTPRSPSNFSYVSSRYGPHGGYSTPSHVQARLPLLGLDDWEEGRVYDEQPPVCIHYSIEWKLALNKRFVTRDTEQNLVLAPSAYWITFLKPKLERLIAQKFSRDQRVRPDDTEMIIAINDRSEHNLTKRFEKTEIDWSLVEDQLMKWGDLFRAGKKLRLIITFYYLGDNQSRLKKGGKRGSSATQRMRGEMEDQSSAARTSGSSDTWRQVYQLMRCCDKTCKQGVHCFEDPVTQKPQHHLASLRDFVDDGGTLRTEDDIPDWFQEQLKAEERVLKTKSKDKDSPVSKGTYSPIQIVVPAQPLLSSASATTPAGVPDASSASTRRCKRLEILGPRDVALRNYSDWHASNVDDHELKNDYRKVC